MERKLTNLGRAKKKLRYFQAEETAPCHLKIKDVFSMHDLDNIFDDLDSGPGTLLLSTLPKTPGLDEQVTGSNSAELKPPLMFTEVISPLKASDSLVAEIDIHTEHLNGKESPLDVIAPITTSSPIELLTVEVVTSERPDTTPLLFVEDEEPVGGDLMTPMSDHRSESPHEIVQAGSESLAFVQPTKNANHPETRESNSEILVAHEEIMKTTEQDSGPVTSDSESLVSPPARIDLKKCTKQDSISESPVAPPAQTEQKLIPLTSSTLFKVSDGVDQQSQAANIPRAEAPEESQMEESSSVSSSVLNQLKPITEGKVSSQAPELGLELEGKEPSFQQKLFNALQLRMKSCKKSQPAKHQRDDPAPLAPEDDFMILDDEAPIRFVIPKKGRTAPTPAPENLHTKKTTLNVEAASPERPEERQNVKDKPDAVKQNTKNKPGKARDICPKEGAAPVETEQQGATSTDAREHIGTAQDGPGVTEKSLTAGRRKTKGKTNTEVLGPKRRKSIGDAFKTTSTALKQRAKLPTNGPGEEPAQEPAELPKKKPNKAKATVKESSSACGAFSTTRRKKKNLKDRTAMRKNQEGDGAHHGVDEILDHTETHIEEIHVQPATRNTTTDVTAEKIPKPPVTKSSTSKKPARLKKIPRAKEASKIKELPVPESDVSTNAAQASKRKRKLPGDWWLTQGHRDTLQPPQEPQSKKNVSRKAPAVVPDLTERQSPRSSEKSPKKAHKPESIQEATKNLKESQPDAKTTRGRQKAKSGAPSQQEITPEESVGDRTRDDPAAEEQSAVPRGSPRWQSSTPGDKRLFAKTYSRASACESAQKRPPAANTEPEPTPEKRQRRAPSNWWEVPESQVPDRRSTSSQPRPPVRSRSQAIPKKGALDNVAGPRKASGCARKRNQPGANTPKSVRTSTASFAVPSPSGNLQGSKVRNKKWRRRLLHSMEDESEQSSENTQPENDQPRGGGATIDVCASGTSAEASSDRRKTNTRFSTGSNQAHNENAFRSGPSSMIELERFEDHDSADLPSSRTATQAHPTPRFLSDCDMCGSPLKPVTLEQEDWDNICFWFNHLWPAVSKNGQAISADDFHWHCHAGRAMGHMIDFETDTFSSGKILLGSFMKKPEQVDHGAVTVFNVYSSCVRVEVEGAGHVYNAGCTFLVRPGTSYSIHNMCRKPAVLWYHRMFSART